MCEQSLFALLITVLLPRQFLVYAMLCPVHRVAALNDATETISERTTYDQLYLTAEVIKSITTRTGKSDATAGEMANAYSAVSLCLLQRGRVHYENVYICIFFCSIPAYAPSFSVPEVDWSKPLRTAK